MKHTVLVPETLEYKHKAKLLKPMGSGVILALFPSSRNLMKYAAIFALAAVIGYPLYQNFKQTTLLDGIANSTSTATKSSVDNQGEKIAKQDVIPVADARLVQDVLNTKPSAVPTQKVQMTLIQTKGTSIEQSVHVAQPANTIIYTAFQLPNIKQKVDGFGFMTGEVFPMMANASYFENQMLTADEGFLSDYQGVRNLFNKTLILATAPLRNSKLSIQRVPGDKNPGLKLNVQTEEYQASAEVHLKPIHKNNIQNR
jgi:hypothetical protein